MTTDHSVEAGLLANIKASLPRLETLLDRARSHWEYEDYVYRFYHGSFKVFGVQRVGGGVVSVRLAVVAS